MQPVTSEGKRVEDGFQRVASLAEVPEGELRAFDLSRGRVAVAHVEQEIFALADECPHDLGSLAEGELDETEDAVICPGDGSAFDLRTGEPLDGPSVDPVTVFAVRLNDEWIEIGPPADTPT
jgi:3-phenylpropionate/trans-cinnamate dioxygenase ferredoxin subunit